MRIGKKGTGRLERATRSVYAKALTFVIATTVTTVMFACGAPPADANKTDSGSRKSTAGDTSAATGQTATPEKRARVVILGTSLTAGYGLDPAEAYPALLQQMADSAKFNVTIVNAGLSGETSAGALRRAAWVLDQPADAVVLEVGANDGLRGVNPSETQSNLDALIDKILVKFQPSRVVLVQMEAPPNFGRDYTTAFHNAYGIASRNKKIELVPFLLDGVAGMPALNQGDGIHPNRSGSVIVARNMFRSLTPLFTSLSSGTPSATH